MVKENPAIKSIKTILVKNANYITEVLLPLDEFIYFIQDLSPSIVYRETIKHDFFIIHEGIFFKTHGFGVYNFTKLVEAYTIWIQSGKVVDFFRDYTEFQIFAARYQFGLEDPTIYYTYIKYEYNPINGQIGFDQFRDINEKLSEIKISITSGFENRRDYNHATAIGIKDPTEYAKFKESGYYPKNYPEYCEAQQLGFTNKADYTQAKALGYTDPQEFAQFKKTGCKSKAEYDALLKKLQSQENALQKVITQTTPEIDTDFDQKHYEEYFRKHYTLLEKHIELTYLHVFRTTSPREMLIEEKVTKLEKFQGLTLCDKGKLLELRQLRNDVIHSNEKIDPDQAHLHYLFLDTFIKKLIEIQKSEISLDHSEDEDEDEEENEDYDDDEDDIDAEIDDIRKKIDELEKNLKTGPGDKIYQISISRRIKELKLDLDERLKEKALDDNDINSDDGDNSDDEDYS